jgi:hypothetical protein
MDRIPRAKSARWDYIDNPACLDGTRVEELGTIMNWMDNETEHRVCLLTGLAGTGKTTIAKSVAKLAQHRGVVGSSFFCSRDSDERSDIQRIFPTIAFQLSQINGCFRAEVVAAIKKEPDIGHASPDRQLEALIVEPIQAVITWMKSFKDYLGFGRCLPDKKIKSLVLKPLQTLITSVEKLGVGHLSLEIRRKMIVDPINRITASVRNGIDHRHVISDAQFNELVVEPARRIVARAKEEVVMGHLMADERHRDHWVVKQIRRVITSIQEELDNGRSLPYRQLAFFVLDRLEALVLDRPKATVGAWRQQEDSRAPAKQMKVEDIVKSLRSILGSVAENLGAWRSLLDEQLEADIAGFIERLEVFSRPIIAVIDALDECKDVGTPEKILLALSRSIPSVPCLKIMLTSRPESSTRFAVQDASFDQLSKIVILHEVARGHVNEDIRRYLDGRLVEIAKRRGGSRLSTVRWPLMDRLVQKASGFFIFASTICQVVESPGDLQQQLEDIANLPTSTDEGRFGIDGLYQSIMDAAFRRFSDRKLISRCRSVVGTIVLLFDRLPLNDLAQLLDVNTDLIFGVLTDLHSVLIIPSYEDGIISTFHASFHDFLTDRTRSSVGVYVEPAQQHGEITLCLIKYMMRHLRRNICGIDGSEVNEEVNDLAQRKEKFICRSLVYACRYWAEHLLQVSPMEPCTELIQALAMFARSKLLSWIEVLGLLDDLGHAVTSLDRARTWYSVCS